MSTTENAQPDGRAKNATYIELSSLCFPLAEAAVDVVLKHLMRIYGKEQPDSNSHVFKEILARAHAATLMEPVPEVVRSSLTAHDVASKLHALLNKSAFVMLTLSNQASAPEDIWACRLIRTICEQYRRLL